MLQYHLNLLNAVSDLEMEGLAVELAQKAQLQDYFEVDGGVVAELGPEHRSKSQGAAKHHVQSTCTLVLEWEG